MATQKYLPVFVHDNKFSYVRQNVNAIASCENCWCDKVSHLSYGETCS